MEPWLNMGQKSRCVFTKSTGIVVRYGKDDVVVVALFGKVVVVASDLYLYLLDVWVTQMLVMTALKQHAHAFIFGIYVFPQNVFCRHKRPTTRLSEAK